MCSRVDAVIASASSAQKDRAAGQGSLFDMMDLGAGPVMSGGVSEPGGVEPWSQEQRLSDEKELLGFYVSGHPLETLGMGAEWWMSSSTVGRGF